MSATIAPYRLQAYNTAKQSENKMHDDAVARQFGFSGGLVTGVDLFAYMIHMPVQAWGRAFLERGLMEARFVKPVYDGDMLDIEANDANGDVALRLLSRGEVCAHGSASLPRAAPAIDLARYTATAPVGMRLPVDSKSYDVGSWLGIEPQTWTVEQTAAYCDDVRDADPIYASEKLVHPGVIQRLMNRVLVENAILGPWIHVGSRMQLLRPVAAGEQLTARAKVTGNYDKKGHQFVEFDAVVVADETNPVAHCHHIAIYQPRQQAAA